MSPILEEVVEKLAEALGKDPDEVEPLFSSIDPDALENLFASPPGGPDRDQGAVLFPHEGHEIRVEADGTISIEGSPGTTSSHYR